MVNKVKRRSALELQSLSDQLWFKAKNVDRVLEDHSVETILSGDAYRKRLDEFKEAIYLLRGNSVRKRLSKSPILEGGREGEFALPIGKNCSISRLNNLSRRSVDRSIIALQNRRQA